MLDMLYMTPSRNEKIHLVPMCDIADDPIVKQETSRLHLLSVQSPSSTMDCFGSNELKNSSIPQQAHICTFCQYPILENMTAFVENRSYHVSCVRCASCEIPLGFDETCFVKDGMILCRNDYIKQFRKNCAKCDLPISRDDIVMKVRDAVFHIGCFSCYICGIALAKGDLFTMSSQNHLFCHAHYDVVCNTVLREERSSSEQSLPLQLPPPPPSSQPPSQTSVSAREISEEPEDFGDDENQSGHGRSKRMRTSFKHHQLRTMKQYFNLNHNPDAKDLKQLAQKTGLTKRVLQVWFQNARAKYRRSMQCKDGEGLSPPIIHQNQMDINSSVHQSSINADLNLNISSVTTEGKESTFYENGSGSTLVSL